MHPIIDQLFVKRTTFVQSWSRFIRTNNMHWIIVSCHGQGVDNWSYNFATAKACHTIETLLLSSTVDYIRYSLTNSRKILWQKQ